MVTKKKRLCLGLLLSLLGIGNGMQAYKFTIKNNTPYTVDVRVRYHGEANFYGIKICQPDRKKLKPKEDTKLSSGLCTVLEVKASVFQHPISGVPDLVERKKKVIEAEKYYAPVGRAGNTTFVINGPIIKVGNGSKVWYTVTRK